LQQIIERVADMQNYTQEHCSEINSSSKPLSRAEADEMIRGLAGWKIVEKNQEPSLEKMYEFKDFQEALDFTNKIGKIAQAENHHPALLTEWGKVTVDWWTHKIKGLHRNDFIMAAKTEELQK
jgi:4a-hydroxytetrahydrobiopterin dehydratase